MLPTDLSHGSTFLDWPKSFSSSFSSDSSSSHATLGGELLVDWANIQEETEQTNRSALVSMDSQYEVMNNPTQHNIMNEELEPSSKGIDPRLACDRERSVCAETNHQDVSGNEGNNRLFLYNRELGKKDNTYYFQLSTEGAPFFVMKEKCFTESRYMNISTSDLKCKPSQFIEDTHNIALSIESKLRCQSKNYSMIYADNKMKSPFSGDLDILFQLVARLNIIYDSNMIREIHSSSLFPQSLRLTILEALHESGFPVTKKAMAVLGSADIANIPRDAKTTLSDGLPTVKKEMEQQAEKIKIYFKNKVKPFIEKILSSDNIKENKIATERFLNDFANYFAKTYALDVNNKPPMAEGKWWSLAPSRERNFWDLFNTDIEGDSDGTYSSMGNQGHIELNPLILEAFVKGDFGAGLKLFTTLGHEMLHRHQNEQLYRGEGEYKKYALLMNAGVYICDLNLTEASAEWFSNPDMRAYLYMSAEHEKEAHATQRYWADGLIEAFNESDSNNRNYPKNITGKRVKHKGLSAEKFPYQSYNVSYTVNGKTHQFGLAS